MPKTSKKKSVKKKPVSADKMFQKDIAYLKKVFKTDSEDIVVRQSCNLVAQLIEKEYFSIEYSDEPVKSKAPKAEKLPKNIFKKQ